MKVESPSCYPCHQMPQYSIPTDDGDLDGFENDSSSNCISLHLVAASPNCIKDGCTVIQSLLAFNPIQHRAPSPHF
eukprot:15367180-Ditylum_brightwellii.AAC.2